MALRLSPSEMAALVPESEGWHGGIYHWIISMGTFEGLISYAELLWPDFAEFDGCVFRGAVDADNYQAWMDQLAGDRTAVEKICNHVDLIYLFQGAIEGATDAQLTYVGQLLRDTWEAKLARDYPDRRFAVEHHDNPSNPDNEPLITFSQIRDA